jgi:hypothetical protein
MLTKKRLFLSLLAVAMVLAILVLPTAASAGYLHKESGWMWVPAHFSSPRVLSVDGISVSVPPGAIPDGGLVVLTVVRDPHTGWFQVDFLPDREFPVSVTMDFGDVYELNYLGPDGAVPIVPHSEVRVHARFLSQHFSRYSGWH